MEANLAWGARIVVAIVFGVSAACWVGWATGTEQLTRVFASWPVMHPWSAVLLTLLGVAILLRLGHPSAAGAFVGLGAAVLTGVLAGVFIAEYAIGKSFGLDQVFFPEEVRAARGSWPGRPSLETALAAALLSLPVALMRSNRKRIHVIWPLFLSVAMVIPVVTTVRYTFQAFLLMDPTRSSDQAFGSVLGLVLLTIATTLARPDLNPLAWLLARSDRWTLIRLVAILAALPIAVGLSRLVFANKGLRGDAMWVSSITVGTIVVGVVAVFASQREQRLLIEKESLSRQRAEAEAERAEAEARYRILADNAVDVVVHVRGETVVWISKSVEAAFGEPPDRWIGGDFLSHVHPDDAAAVVAALQEITSGKTAVVRFRVIDAGGVYHWVDGRAKPYIDAAGNIDGATGSLRIIDKEVEAERKLERMARFDSLTGLVNRAEALARLESGLRCARSPGTGLGVLFCDVDDFKAVNDTLGHAAGDAVLSTVADRISQCVRHGDTVGRTGGDEILVLLPNLHSLDEVDQIAEKIRARNAEPIQHAGKIFHVTLSIGGTMAIPGESVSDLTARADAAMYRAKRRGGNAAVVS